MTLRVWSLGLGLGLAGAACSGFNVGDSAGCVAACERAAVCGFVPSALGWSAEPELESSVTDCVRRCGNSPRSDPTVSALLTCLDGEQQSSSWCDDQSAAEYLRWQDCAGIAACLDGIAARELLAGQAALQVSLVGFADFEADFGPAVDTGGVEDSGGVEDPLTIAELYATPFEPGAAVTSCRAALCSDALCGLTEELRPCDDTLCRNPSPVATQVCETLGIERITLTARQPGAMQVRQTLYDAEADDTQSCGKAITAVNKADDYGLVPGPVSVELQVTGTLPAAELAQIDYEGASALAQSDPTATMRYCLNFVGPAVILRAGDNPVVIPIGSVSELVERGLDAATLGVCPA